MSKIKKIILFAWLLALIAIYVYYLAYPEVFTSENLASFLKKHENGSLLIFLALHLIRGLTLLPSTPLVLAGALLFPDSPWLVIGISTFGVLLSSLFIYYFADYLGFASFFEKKFPKKIAFVKSHLHSRWGPFYVALWAFFPLVPTDLMCYVAGSIRMKVWLLGLAVAIGEFLLITLYVLGIQWLWTLLGF